MDCIEDEFGILVKASNVQNKTFFTINRKKKYVDSDSRTL